MKKTTIILIIIAVVLGIVFLPPACTYLTNNMTEMEAMFDYEEEY